MNQYNDDEIKRLVLNQITAHTHPRWRFAAHWRDYFQTLSVSCEAYICLRPIGKTWQITKSYIKPPLAPPGIMRGVMLDGWCTFDYCLKTWGHLVEEADRAALVESWQQFENEIKIPAGAILQEISRYEKLYCRS
jgi:hypothetical protein